VAAFFAAERARADGAVWALNGNVVATKSLKKISPSHAHPFTTPFEIDPILRNALRRSLLEGDFHDLVVPVVPAEATERLAIQQGLFVASVSEKLPFEASLARTFAIDPAHAGDARVIEFRGRDDEDALFAASRESVLTKVVIERRVHKDALDDLRSMNVTAATLFPGLDGYARSLDYWVRSDQLPSADEEMIRRLVLHVGAKAPDEKASE
jgi:hypothetical protein